MSTATATRRELLLRARRFHDLAPHRVREMLLVSSPYDAFLLEEDGQLTEQVFREYEDISLSGPPRVTHVATGRAALESLRNKRFDLILVMSSLADMTVNAFGQQVKRLRPGRPVVFLALDQRELETAEQALDPSAIDGAFLWTGDSLILLAIIKYVEDRANVDHDIQHGNVRVILVLEDSPRYYSSFLGMLYKELMKQARSLYLEGVNELQRRMHMRSRPKILLAQSFEAGVELARRYEHNLMAVISDVRIPSHGVIDPAGGLELCRLVRQKHPDLPILLQSAESENQARAGDLATAFADKGSPSLASEISRFLRDNLGFGDFVFRMPDSTEVDRAVDVRDLERKLATVPEESLRYHALHDHFSIWLMARSEFALAEQLRPKKISDFQGIEAMRRYLVDQLRATRQISERGSISDFRRESFAQDRFSRIGTGSLGGKARGLAFLNMSLANLDATELGSLAVQVPKTVVITTEAFDRFLEHNAVDVAGCSVDDDETIATRFTDYALPLDLLDDLELILDHLRGPLAVRSSSVLEDSMHQPFAGIYTTLMIPNTSEDRHQRLRELGTAIKLVYASTFYRNARSYLASTGSRAEEEKMAVIIQPVVGRLHGRRFYPSFSGVAQSRNFYPIGPQQPEDGVVHLALGLGRTVVDGGLALRFSPRHPGVLPQLATPKLALHNTQRDFYALDVDRSCCAPGADLYSTVRRFDLAAAEEDGTLAPVASVFSRDDERLRDDLSYPGPRVVSFNNILKHQAIPLADTATRLLEVARAGLGCEVEIEFACDMGDYGAVVRRGQERQPPVLYALQVRPFAARNHLSQPARLRFRGDEVLCSSGQTLGHGIESRIRDVVYVRPQSWRAADNKAIAREVGRINDALGQEGRGYLLIGPGRWGTADEWLGIPVQWAQISSVRAIVEASPAGYDVEPSQGTHFFQNITSLQIAYFTLPPGAQMGDGREDFLDWQWLEAQPAHTQTEHLRHLRLAEPLTVVLDGREHRGVIAKPGARGELAREG